MKEALKHAIAAIGLVMLQTKDAEYKARLQQSFDVLYDEYMRAA